MEKQYSVKFFNSLLTSFHQHCKQFLDFNQLVEVSGYVCVEIDNTKKERYVLSELVQSCGNVISESYCTKAFKTPFNLSSKKQTVVNSSDSKSEVTKTSKVKSESPLKDESNERSRSPEDHGLKIFSVSSLADQEKEEASESLIEEEVVVLTSDEVESKAKKSKLLSKHLLKNEWEGKDTFVYSFPHTKSNPKSKEEPKPSRSLWHQPADCSNQDLDDLLNQGQDWSESLPTTGVEDIEMKLGAASTEAESDLAVLSNDYFTAQMLAHTSKAFDTSVFQDSNKLEDAEKPGKSKDNDEIMASRSRHIGSASSSTSVSSPGDKSECVLVIDEDSDDIVEIDMDQSSEEDSMGMSHDMSGSAGSSPRRKMSQEEEEKQRRRYRSSLKYQRYAVKLFNDFQKKQGENVRPIQTMHPEKLDEVLADFYTSLRKNNGEEFGSMSLRNVQSHLERYLRDANYPFSITRDPQFRRSKQILTNKIALARARARALPNPGKPTLVNDDDINILFEMGELGGHSPDALLNSMWFMNSMFLQIKQNADHYYLKWGDIGLSRDQYGREILECFNGKSKGRRVFYDDSDSDQCFVQLYKIYHSKRPPCSMTPTSPFYLSPSRAFTADSPWFSIDRASVSRLTGVFKKMASAAGLEGRRLP